MYIILNQIENSPLKSISSGDVQNLFEFHRGPIKIE